MKRSASYQNGDGIHHHEESGSVPEERDVKPIAQQLRMQSGLIKSKVSLRRAIFFCQLSSKDKVRLTNLNSRNSKANPLNEYNPSPAGENAKRIVLQADQPVIGDALHVGGNWKLQGLICYNVSTDVNFHVHLMMTPKGDKDNVDVTLSLKACPEREKSIEMISDIQGYAVSLRLVAKDKTTLLATGTKKWDLSGQESRSDLSGVIHNFCSIANVRSADELHTFKIRKFVGGNEVNSEGEFDTVEIEVELEILFKFLPDRCDYLKPYVCYQSFQPDNFFRRTEIMNETYKELDGTVILPCKQMHMSSGNPSRYGQVIVLRVGQVPEELYVYRTDLIGRSIKLDQLLGQRSVVDFPNVLPQVMVLFLDLLDEDRKGGSSSNKSVPASFINPDASATCEALKLVKDCQISLSAHVIERLLSKITHNFQSAVEIFSRGQEFGIQELMESGIRYFKEHKEEMRQDTSKKLLEKVEPHVLVSIFNCLL